MVTVVKNWFTEYLRRIGFFQLLVLIIISCVVLVDQVTKYLVCTHLHLGERITIIPYIFNLRYVRNTGAAWGIFENFNSCLVIFSAVILVCLIVFRRFFLGNTLSHKLALALMIAGILGNLLDRVRFQYVVDFLDFHWKPHSFPTFNIADSAICFGVTIYVIASYCFRRSYNTQDRTLEERSSANGTSGTAST